MSEEVWHLAVCMDCKPFSPQSFKDESARNNWLAAHAKATKHYVEAFIEIRGKPTRLDPKEVAALRLEIQND